VYLPTCREIIPCHFDGREEFFSQVGVFPDVFLKLPDLTLEGFVLLSFDDQTSVVLLKSENLKTIFNEKTM
jgi:hypothetical protein